MRWRETLKVWAWSFRNVPQILWVRPAIVELDDARTVVRIRLRRRTRNHQHAMYIGALVVGADVAGGLAAMRAIEGSGGGMTLIFRTFGAEFLKRAEGDTFFTCEDGEAIRELVALARSSGQREEMAVRITATVPSLLGNEPVANFTLGLSVKQKDRR